MADETRKEIYSVEEPEPDEDAADRSEGRDPASPAHHGVADSGEGGSMCPECGAALDPGDETCIRCGFTTVDQRAERAASGEGALKSKTLAPDETAEIGRPISPTGRSHGLDFWLPAVLGSASLLLLVIGYLAGAAGLFPLVRPDEAAASVPWGTRFIELLRTLVLLAFWTGCGLAGLFMLALMFERPLGDARIAALRVAAIMATIRLAAFITVPGPRWVEWMTESILQAAGFVLLSMLLFRLAIRNAATLAMWTLMAILLLWLFTYAVQWALGG